jgi:hypothetical protein
MIERAVSANFSGDDYQQPFCAHGFRRGASFHSIRAHYTQTKPARVVRDYFGAG